MKKLMTSTIIVLPLILLAILLVSGAIMSFSVHIYVEAVELTNKDTIVLVMDDENNPPSYNLGSEVTVFPIKATNRKLSYKSEDENIVTIDNNGIIHANFYGEAYVTITSKENLAASATRKVIVTDDKVHAVRINEQCTDLYEGENMRLTANIYPQEAQNKGLKWTSSNPAILDVSANGTATALGAGIAKVIATSAENESIFAELEINCHKKLTGLTFDKTAVQTTAKTIEFPKISALPTDIDEADITYTYSSNNEEVATVNNTGTIQFLKPGKVTITVAATDFRNEKITEQKTFISTMGYFTKPIFATNEIDWSNCHAGEELSSDWLISQLEGTQNGISSIECMLDGTEQISDVIKFENNKFVFGNNLECDAFIDVTIHAQIFNFDTYMLEDYSETIKINKSPSESGINAVVKLNGSELNKGEINKITISNLQEQLVLDISGTEAQPKISSNSYVGVNISNNKITLTGKASCQDVNMDLSIGVSKYTLQVTVKAQADIIEVSLDKTKIINEESYNTLLDELTFNITLKRSDKAEVTDNVIQYRLNADTDFISTETSQLQISTSSNHDITIKSGTAEEFTFNINKTTLNDFGIKINSASATLDTIDSVAETSQKQISIPSKALDQITLEIVTDNFLGGFGSDDIFKEMFNVNLDGLEGWAASYSALNKQITLKFDGKQEFNNKVTISYKDLSITLQLLRVNLTSIEFKGFDIINKKDDIYLGYQQARVFAKHSYYGSIVDYFKIPFKAISTYIGEQSTNPEVISWTLTRVNDNTNEQQIITSQLGYEVIYNGTTYTIIKDGDSYVLKDAAGDVVVGADGINKKGIIWVDVFSEPGYARIYFGNFAGLSESDIQNSYFGNFADEEHWKKTQQVEGDDTDRIVIPSANAFTFLQIEAGDGAIGGANRHYNFNVLGDDEVINIFDAEGYYNNDKIVLHTNLYGPGEIEASDEVKAPDEKLILSSPDNVSKTTVYGNGYHINLQARNQQLIDAAKTEYDISRLGYHDGASFEHIYNLTLMGSNPTDKISRNKQAMVFRIGYAYYCDVQYMAKINTFYDNSVPDTGNSGNNRDGIGSYSYIKNSLMRYASWVCYQLSFPNDKAYFENCVFVESNAAITMENIKPNMGCYFKGFNDILCYDTLDKISKDKNLAGFAYDALQNPNDQYQYDKFAEWFGKDNDGFSDIDMVLKNRYVNPIVFDATYVSSNKPYFWNGEHYVEESDDFTIVFKFFGYYPGWTYNKSVERDGGEKVGNYYTTRDMSKLFDNPDDIRLLCQYKTIKDGTLVGNTDHVEWHMQQVYRNPNLIIGRETNHIEHLKSTLKDIVWPDGTTANEAIELSNQNATSNVNLFLPNKKEEWA